jgi:hypothetical protein
MSSWLIAAEAKDEATPLRCHPGSTNNIFKAGCPSCFSAISAAPTMYSYPPLGFAHKAARDAGSGRPHLLVKKSLILFMAETSIFLGFQSQYSMVSLKAAKYNEINRGSSLVSTGMILHRELTGSGFTSTIVLTY